MRPDQELMHGLQEHMPLQGRLFELRLLLPIRVSKGLDCIEALIGFRSQESPLSARNTGAQTVEVVDRDFLY
jgi:hypothetical protein